MKKRLYILLCAGLTIAATSCSDISEDERLIELPLSEDVGQTEDIDPEAPFTAVKHVLIEDFTGQACVNCPAATQVITQLEETFGEERIIAVGLYGGNFGQTVSGRYYTLTTDIANYYYTKYGVTEQPCGRIDGHGLNTNYYAWSTEVYNAIQQTTPLDLRISNTYDADSRIVSIAVTGRASEAVSGMINVWLTEDGIIDYQYVSDGSRNDAYVHNHVLRAAVTDLDGEVFSVDENREKEYTFTTTLDEAWEADNVSVVVFVEGGSSVLQTAKASVITAAAPEEEGQTTND